MVERRIEKLEEELKRIQGEFTIFYEITQAMRSTLYFDEILYIILTGITAHQGLGFNRAALFGVDPDRNKIKGIMGIGPQDAKEAENVWKWIEKEKKGLYDLIKEYRRARDSKTKPNFFKLIESLEFTFSPESGIICEVFSEGLPLHIKKENIHNLEQDPMYKTFQFSEAALVPLWAGNKVVAAIFADNFVTQKPITPKDLKMLNMFASQASLAIENSKLFEDTLVRSHTDSLTGLWNYGYFQYKLDEYIDQALRFSKSFCLLMIDIDDFKKYNDTFGHPEGDIALVNIGSVIKESCRREDLICRYGGEEFAVILPNILKDEALVIAERIRSSVARAKDKFKTEFTVSIGIGSFPKDSQNKKSLISSADLCLYKAKQEGKNRVVSVS